MIKTLSTTYSKEHCTCYDNFDGDNLVAVMIVPDGEYKLRYADKDNTFDISGFALININVIDTFGNYIAVENSPITPTEDEEISDSEALSIIISGGNDNDESGS